MGPSGTSNILCNRAPGQSVECKRSERCLTPHCHLSMTEQKALGTGAGSPSRAKHEADTPTQNPGSECRPRLGSAILQTKETQAGTPERSSRPAAQETQGSGSSGLCKVDPGWCVWPLEFPWAVGSELGSPRLPMSSPALLPSRGGEGGVSALSTPVGAAPIPPAQ